MKPYGCFEIRDTYGPFLTRQECVIRATDIKDNWKVPLHIPYGFKCVTPGEGV
jgi:hypothetical protein